MFVDLSLKDFLKETASNSPAPGGGSVSALAGALGAALTLMVTNLTADSEEIALLRKDGEKLLSDLEEYIDADTVAFTKVMASYKLPKATDEEKALRSSAIQSALKEAAVLPMNTAESCIEVMRLSLKALECGNSNAASDAASAGILSYAGMRGALYNVRINIASIKDSSFVSGMQSKTANLFSEGEKLLAELTSLADKKIN
jgi:formiminotetrahydrofolate cyclodeaminase